MTDLKQSPTQPDALCDAPLSRRTFLRLGYGFAGLGLSLLVSTDLLAAPQATKTAAATLSPLPQRKPQPPRLLMIDPGHGGRDPGAIGRSGTYEKDITLDIARRLAQHVSGKKRLNAKLTRDRDEFLPLAERVRLGRESRADLFISIHADSAPNPAARGLSAYTLSGNASDDFAKALARQENLADAVGGVDLGQTDEEVAAILMDLTARHARNAAQRARYALVQGIGKEWHLLENPLRSANFAVLRAPDMPSMLIESGFLSNSDDEALLRKPVMRDKIARLLAREVARILNNPPFG